ncbi:gamma-glutamyl-gamma-aminobutyrate hydrolase family protein [Metallumcola ferriviriculae]|uniref:Gamma-glutamyl-gamma-aminobutyrate hydrolase family protein n=1 Tax=Metallumcola ferriviriculae TaxID=3039180 RepID=A0AAU0UT41_9FIRM|nr:gamma-glutamyl-gamma-aminobutyrate hydrolase family protein [Desulfitibacteraceae bacterium MK1]
MKPIIGITCSEEDELGRYYLSYHYVLAVEHAGGTPLLLPSAGKSVNSFVHLLDGLLLSGGVDVDPVFFGEEPLPGMGEMTPRRDSFEISLTKEFLLLDKPLLAVCRGIQVLNIAAGGNIFQDIYSQYSDAIQHSQRAARHFPSHAVTISPDTILKDIILADKIRVNSFHHQAVRKIAPQFTICAQAGDGIVEAIESEKNTFVVGVQWHPECMWQNDENSRRLFAAFVEACYK